jgi:hypothetical protein
MKKVIVVLVFGKSLFSCENKDLPTLQKTLIIASQKADCVGLVAQKCFLVKEQENQNWQYFYDSIKGFTYQEGFEYEIAISEDKIENPPQDASSIETTLIEVISKVKKTSENLPN